MDLPTYLAYEGVVSIKILSSQVMLAYVKLRKHYLAQVQ